jgi:hypothetical protein
MPRFANADQLNAWLDWRDDIIRAAGDVPAYRSPEFFAADPATQMASYQLNEVPRQVSNRMAAEYERREAERDASHDLAEAGHGRWTELAHRVADGRGAYIPREPVIERSRGDPPASDGRANEAVDRAVDAVHALTDEDRQRDAATSAAADETAQTTERSWTA